MATIGLFLWELLKPPNYTTAIKASADNKNSWFFYNRLSSSRPTNPGSPLAVSSLWWFLLLGLCFICFVISPLWVSSGSTQRNRAPSVSAAQLCGLCKAASSTALLPNSSSFWLEQENKHAQIITAVSGTTIRKVIQDCLTLIFPDSQRYFPSALDHWSPSFLGSSLGNEPTIHPLFIPLSLMRH